MESIYGLFVILSTLVFVLTFIWLWKTSKYSMASGIGFLMGAWIVFIVGSRMCHYLTNSNQYQTGELSLVSLEWTGFSLYGGIILVTLYTYIWSKYMNISIWYISDYVCGAFGVGFITMRFGCYLNGCCFGKPLSGLWGKTYGFLSYSHVIQHQKYNNLFPLSVHPTQMYEILFTIIGMAIGYAIWKKYKLEGIYAFIFSIIFTLGRLINLYFREPLSNSMYHQSMFMLYPAIILILLVGWINKNEKK